MKKRVVFLSSIFFFSLLPLSSCLGLSAAQEINKFQILFRRNDVLDEDEDDDDAAVKVSVPVAAAATTTTAIETADIEVWNRKIAPGSQPVIHISYIHSYTCGMNVLG